MCWRVRSLSSLNCYMRFFLCVSIFFPFLFCAALWKEENLWVEHLANVIQRIFHNIVLSSLILFCVDTLEFRSLCWFTGWGKKMANYWWDWISEKSFLNWNILSGLAGDMSFWEKNEDEIDNFRKLCTCCAYLYVGNSFRLIWIKWFDFS